MGKKINLEFDYMQKGKVVAHVVVKAGGEITCDLYTDDVMDNPLPFGNTGESLSHFFETRCFPQTRGNAAELLELLELKHYNPIAIVKKTRGLQNDDFYWIRFTDDTATWNEIKLRD
ncbi:hypothetical protein IZY60_15155 [Lutibacter sp. B2]|nr:hypothetical protein [Lutibacter sp. B2]